MMNILIWALSFGIAVFQFVDYWTTLKVIERGGTEENQFMQFLFKGFGVRTGLIIGKFYAAMFVLCGAFFGWWDRHLIIFGRDIPMLVFLILLFGIYGVVVNHNLEQYKNTR